MLPLKFLHPSRSVVKSPGLAQQGQHGVVGVALGMELGKVEGRLLCPV
jgi:hypothetical protein